MWAPHQTPGPIEKIKTRWTPENTARTQATIARLVDARRHLRGMGLYNGDVVDAIEAALTRFHELDAETVIPFL
jgi:hypothetical protein